MKDLPQMNQQVLLRLISKMLIPFILMFGIYVITHGEVGPGGGFQGGVLLAAAFILYGLVFGVDELKRVLPTRVTDVTMALGAFIYAGTGAVNLFVGGNFLDYGEMRNLFGGSRGDMQAWGLTSVEYGVGITVCSVMVTIYTQICERPPASEPEPQTDPRRGDHA